MNEGQQHDLVEADKKFGVISQWSCLEGGKGQLKSEEWRSMEECGVPDVCNSD